MAKKKAAPVKGPTDIHTLLNQLGIVAPSGNVSRETNAQGVLQAANVLGAQRVATAPQVQTTTAKFGSKTYAPTVAWSDTPSLKSNDGGIGWGTIGDIFKKAIEVVDTPRSYAVSAAKELGDFGNHFLDEHANWVPHWSNPDDKHGSASFRDFLDQGKRHYGGQDMIHDSTGINQTGSWHDLDNLLGFGIDAAADPMTYLGAGEFKGGKAVIDEGIAAAVKNGGRNEIAKAIAKRVAEDGVEGADELLANAGRKGAGALTKKGLKEAGITAEKAAELGLPRRAYAFAGMEIPGSSAVSDVVQNLKGAAKETFGESAAGKFMRRLRVSDQFGERGFIDTIRGAKGNPIAQAAAVKALSTVNVSKAKTFGWLTETLQGLKKSELGQVFRKGSKLEKEALIDASESAGTHTLLNQFLDKMHTDLTEKFGVDLAYRENYVPHMLTQEARDLATPEVKAITDAIQSKVGIQQVRELNQPIATANAQFLEKHGVKLFEDDPNTIVLKYLHQATNAVGKAAQGQALIDFKVASVIPGLTAEETAKAALGLDVANATREELVAAGADVLKTEKADVLRQIKEIKQGTEDLGRKAVKAQGAVSKYEKDLEALKAKLEIATKAVKPARALARGETKIDVAAIESQIVATTEKLGQAKDAVHYIMNESQVNLGAKATASKGFVAETKRLEGEMAALTSQHVDLTNRLEQLKMSVNKPGAGPLAADLNVQTARVRVADTAQKLAADPTYRGAKREADLAQGVYDMAIADKDSVLSVLDAQKTELDNTLRRLGRKRNPQSLSASAEYATVLQENTDILKAALAGSDDPAVELIARLEATANSVDATHMAATARWDEALKSMKDPRFKLYMQQEVETGMKRLNETYQIPDWADQALQSRSVFNDNEWGQMIRFYDKSLNLMKGYMIARPGFVIRNAYSSVFNVYLEAGAGAFDSLRTYQKFYKIFRENPETYHELALAKFGDQEIVDRLESALHASSATGGGLAPDEFNVGFLDGASAKPWSADFAPIKGVRAASERVEHLVRGGHAFDVLQRGGSLDLAIDTVNKWHFNYRDLTNFDRQAKRVMPFWTFFSRNMSLQASTFQSILPKLNRTYFNAARQLQSGQPADTTPSYYDAANPLRLGTGSGGNQNYLFPDLPPLQAQSDIANMIQSKGSSLASQLTPAIKIPLDLFSDKQSYSGIPFSDKYRKAPIWAQFPGASILPGIDQGGKSGDNVLTDRTQYVYENLFPTLGQGARLSDTSKGANPLMAWLGMSVRTNTDKTRNAEIKRRERAMQAEMKRIKDLQNA